jgi:hypothetical protein
MSLSQDEKRIVDDHIFEILKTVVEQTTNFKDVVARALHLFLVREFNSWRSIRILQNSFIEENDERGFMVDSGTLLRAMYDASLQAEYVVKDRNEAVNRANDYLDFEHIERYRLVQKVKLYDDSFTKKMMESPQREEGEKNVQQQFDLVKGRYFKEKKRQSGIIQKGPGTREYWFPGRLRDVAIHLEKEDEYDRFLFTLQGCVHSSAWALRIGPPFAPQYALDWASKIALCVAKLNVEYNIISLSDLQKTTMNKFCKPIFSFFNDEQ